MAISLQSALAASSNPASPSTAPAEAAGEAGGFSALLGLLQAAPQNLGLGANPLLDAKNPALQKLRADQTGQGAAEDPSQWLEWVSQWSQQGQIGLEHTGLHGDDAAKDQLQLETDTPTATDSPVASTATAEPNPAWAALAAMAQVRPEAAKLAARVPSDTASAATLSGKAPADFAATLAAPANTGALASNPQASNQPAGASESEFRLALASRLEPSKDKAEPAVLMRSTSKLSNNTPELGTSAATAPTPTPQVLTANSTAPAAAPSSTAPTHIALPIEHPAWPTQVGQSVHFALGQGKNSIDLQLNPPQLGPLEVRINMEQGETKILFMTPHAPVKEAIESSMNQLQDVFRQAGMNMVQVDVSTSGQSGGQMAFWAEQQAQAKRPLVPEFAADGLKENSATLEVNSSSRPWQPASQLPGQLDLYV